MKKNSINWDDQWAAHSPGYRDGCLYLDINNKILKLKAGPGFGDLSHPTTNLVLKLMMPLVAGKHVVDVGSGSGILSFAAAAIGARSVCGVDIDPEAIDHSRANNRLNQMEETVSFMLPLEYVQGKRKSPVTVLMNMIQSEQTVAWDALQPIHKDVEMAITSGILSADREAYLELTQQWGWELVEEQVDGEWAGFVFQ